MYMCLSVFMWRSMFILVVKNWEISKVGKHWNSLGPELPGAWLRSVRETPARPEMSATIYCALVVWKGYQWVCFEVHLFSSCFRLYKNMSDIQNNLLFISRLFFSFTYFIFMGSICQSSCFLQGRALPFITKFCYVTGTMVSISVSCFLLLTTTVMELPPIVQTKKKKTQYAGPRAVKGSESSVGLRLLNPPWPCRKQNLM